MTACLVCLLSINPNDYFLYTDYVTFEDQKVTVFIRAHKTFHQTGVITMELHGVVSTLMKLWVQVHRPDLATM